LKFPIRRAFRSAPTAAPWDSEERIDLRRNRVDADATDVGFTRSNEEYRCQTMT